MMTMRRLFVASALLLWVTPALSQAQAPPPPPPLKIVSVSERVMFTENGVAQSFFKVVPERPLKLATSGAMTLVVFVRPLAGSRQLDVSITVDAGGAPKLMTSSISASLPVITLSDGSAAYAAKVISVPIDGAMASVSVEIPSGAAVVGFARMPHPGASAPVAAAPTPAPASTPAPVAPTPTPAAPLLPGGSTATALKLPGAPVLPGASAPANPALPVAMALPGGTLIRRRVERLSLGAKVAAVVPAGAVDPLYGDGTTNVYLGAELRATLPVMERKISLCAEAGTYQLKDIASVQNTSPFGSSLDADVTVTTKVIPIVGSVVYKVKLSEHRALYAGAGGGPVLTSRTEEIAFRNPTTTSETRMAGIGRAGAEQKVGPGRVVLEGSYIHVLSGKDPRDTTYLGGALVGLQYRFIF